MKKFSIALFFLPAVLLSQVILFQDDFSDGNPDGWIPLFPEGVYFVNASLRYDISYTGANNVDPTVVRGDSASFYMTVNDYSVLAEGIAYNPSDFLGIFLRGTMGQTGYTAYLRPLYDDICILRHDGPDIRTALGTMDSPNNLGQFYWIRFECEGNLLRAKAWQGEASDEPADWLLTVVDSVYDNYGFTGFSTGRYGFGSSHAEFDNFVVTTVGSGPLDQITWAGVKTALR